ncbi:MAG: hypothetical protein ACO1OB_23870 [Archangium sp.]
MRRVALCVLVGLLGCKSEKLKNTETELAAAKARVATMDTRRADMVKELTTIESSRRKAARDADATEYAIARLNGALLVLDGKPVPDGLLLDEAHKAKPPELGRLAATIVQRRLPCADDETDAEESGDECTIPPVPDACEGVPERTVQDFSWSCDTLLKHTGGPTIAVCTSLLTSDENVGAVRLAFLHEERVIVGDYPQPSTELYQPYNTSERDACTEENSTASCEASCDSKYGRGYSCYDPYEGGDGYIPEEDMREADEHPELTAARIAAADAERASREADEEVQYQECRAGCTSEPVEPTERLPSGFDYVATIAPGVIHLHNQTGPDADGGFVEGDALISFPAYNSVLAGDFETDKDDVEGLELELYSDDGFVMDTPADGAVLIAGHSGPHVSAVQVFLDGKKQVRSLPTAEACEFVQRMKNQQLSALCTKQLADEAARAARLAAADAGVADAGVPVFDGGVDAGGAP